MLLHKISSLVTLTAIVFSLLGITSLSPLVAQALVAESPINTETSYPPAMLDQARQCPISGFASIEFNGEEEIQIDSEFGVVATLQNTSNYVLSGVRVGLGVYSNESQITPDYWFVMDNTYQLSLGDSRDIPLAIDASIMPAGEYIVRAFVMQGDETAVLGAMLRGDGGAMASVVKSGQQAKDVSVDVEVNGIETNGQTIVLEQGENIEAQIVTSNNSDTPVLSSSLIAVINQGDVPLGAAVRETVNDSVRLVPGGNRNTQVYDRFTESGRYSVLAGLVTPNTFQPLERVSVVVGDEPAALSWAYLSKVGSSQEVLLPTTEIVGCVNYIGEASDSVGLIETLGMSVSVTDGDSVVFEDEVTTGDSLKNYLTIQPGVSVALSDVTVSLLQGRFASVVAGENATPTDEGDDIEIELNAVQTIEFGLECLNTDACEGESAATETMNQNPAGETTAGNSFYFYAAIVVAAALLLYIMLRRLHPEDDLTKRDNSNELQ